MTSSPEITLGSSSYHPIDSSPLFNDIFEENNKSIAKRILKAATPNIIQLVSLLLLDTISLYYIGHNPNSLYFPALGFGTTWITALGYGIVFGISSGFNVYASQAYGARNFKKLGLLYQKTIFIQLIAVVFTLFLSFLTKPILLSMKFNAAMAPLVQEFVQASVVAVAGDAVFMVTSFYLIAQKVYDIEAYITAVATVFHVLWCHIFIVVLDWGIAGAGIAKGVTMVLMCIAILIYCKLYQPHPEAWFPWTKECLEDLGPYLKSIIGQGAADYLEWILFEIVTLLISLLDNPDALAGHSAALNYIYTISQPTASIAIATCTILGTTAGEGNVEKAKRVTRIGVQMNILLTAFFLIATLLFQSTIANFYTDQVGVVPVTEHILKIYAFGIFGDVFTNMLGYMIRTLNHEQYVYRAFLVCYYVVGITTSILLAFNFDYGYSGIWIGMIIGFYSMTFICLRKLMVLDWDTEVRMIKYSMVENSDIYKEVEVSTFNTMASYSSQEL